MVRVLIAEDSVVMADILRRVFDGEPDFEIVGVARDGEDVVRLAAQLKPDVITMDVIMPVMDGVAATERIMTDTPTPIVVVSSHVNDREMRVTFRSLAAGALSVLEKPENIFAADFEKRRKLFVDNVRMMSEIKVVRRRNRRPTEPAVPAKVASSVRDMSFCALGCSTGGPQALEHILTGLPGDFAAPIVVAQHISRGFTGGMADWLNGLCALTVKVGDDGEPCRPGTVYLAPDGANIAIRPGRDTPHLSIGPEQPLDVLTPSVDHLFQSVAETVGEGAMCGVLTGMGRDGAKGLAAVKEKGGRTFVESEKTCVVFGMPAAALDRGVADHVLRIDQVAEFLQSALRRKRP